MRRLFKIISNIFPFACGTQLEAWLSDRGRAQLSKHSNHRGIKSILMIFILVWSQYIILLDMGKWKERKLTGCYCHGNRPRLEKVDNTIQPIVFVLLTLIHWIAIYLWVAIVLVSIQRTRARPLYLHATGGNAQTPHSCLKRLPSCVCFIVLSKCQLSY